MKLFKSLTILLFVVLLAGCGQQSDEAGSNDPPAAPAKDGHYGVSFNPAGAVAAAEVPGLFKEGETSLQPVKVQGNIPASCTHSGCWMDIDLGEGLVMNVSFRDGEFTIPLDAAGKEAVMTGTAYRELVPAARLRAYAKDEGKSEEEISAITEDGWEYTFVADGVVLR
jgi:hypothetical protein